MGFMGGGKERSLSTIRPFGMGIPPNRGLDMNGIPHLTTSYLPRGEYERFGF